MSDRPGPDPDDLRKSRLALGVCAICLVFLLETSVAHRITPRPESPVVWAVLGLGAALSLAAAVWFKMRGRRRR